MWYNTPISWLLHSPLHGILSSNFLLITVTGRKTGKRYTTPVNYLRDGKRLWIISLRKRTWWRNLKQEAVVHVWLEGRDYTGRGLAIVDPATVSEALYNYLKKMPQLNKAVGVALDEKGEPKREDCDQSANRLVMIRVDLDESASQ